MRPKQHVVVHQRHAHGVNKVDLACVEKVLRMSGGYVLDFSNRTFDNFFAGLGIDIDEYANDGSKANRIREFLQNAPPALASRVLEAFLEFAGPVEGENGIEPPEVTQYRNLVARLAGTRIASPASATQTTLSLQYLHELEGKTNARLATGDFDGAISLARTTLEGVLGELEERLTGKREDYSGDLMRQFKSVGRRLKIDSEHPILDDNFKQVVRGLMQIVGGLAPIRNRMSDAHARERRPAAHHARVTVNAAHTVATFLVESYEFQKKQGTLDTQ